MRELVPRLDPGGPWRRALHSASLEQGELELDGDDDLRMDCSRLMSTLDEINERYGRGTVLMASAGLDGNRRVWSMKQERRTPGYTTCWTDIPVARA